MRDRATATLTTIVVDDEQLARDELTYLLKDFPEIEVIGTGSNGLQALELIWKLEPELVFLDVHMPGLDGLGVAGRLRENDTGLPHIIFVTAYDQHAVEAFRLEALDYLLKPVEKARLAETVERARRALLDRKAETAAGVAGEGESTGASKGYAAGPGTQAAPPPAPRTKLLVRANSRNFIVDANDLIYATIDDGLITLVTTNLEGHSNYRTIEDLQANLDRDLFWRVHRSFLVNINRIKEVVPWFKSSYQLRMDDRKHTELPVSRVQTRRLRELFKL
jgi:two-component system LytT family response regulator/two-component system response regulator LytT